MSDLAAYVKHAERKGGVEGVYEAARTELDDRDLGRLVERLRRIDPDYRLDRAERHRLLTQLIEAKVADRRIIRQLGVSRQTVWRVRRTLVQAPNGGLDTPLQSGAEVTKPAVPRDRSRLHFDATSGAWDDRPLRRYLGMSA